jgi:hypothetical protein
MENNLFVEIREVRQEVLVNEMLKQGWQLINTVGVTDFYTNDNTAMDDNGNYHVISTNMNCTTYIVYILGRTKNAKVIYGESVRDS